MSDAATYSYDVHYFSSAGNDGNAGYIGTFTPTPAKSLITPTIDDGTKLTAVLTGHGAPAEGRDFSYVAGDSSGLTTTGIARTLYSGGLHSFTTNGQASLQTRPKCTDTIPLRTVPALARMFTIQFRM